MIFKNKVAVIYGAGGAIDVATYTRERPGMSGFVLEDGVVYHTYSTYWRGIDGLLGDAPVARPRPQGAQRDGPLVVPPRRVRQAMSEVVGVVASQRAFSGVSALLFAASAAVTMVTRVPGRRACSMNASSLTCYEPGVPSALETQSDRSRAALGVTGGTPFFAFNYYATINPTPSRSRASSTTPFGNVHRLP
jgi:hypothetical protein